LAVALLRRRRLPLARNIYVVLKKGSLYLSSTSLPYLKDI
jgi:hypothetical protein